MPLTHFPFGVSSFGMPVIPSLAAKIYGVGGVGNVTGTGVTVGPGSQVFFVNSAVATASDAAVSNGLDPLRPFKTINFAITRCIANNNDVIFVGPGHIETISAAAGLSFGIAGVTVIGLGNHSERPKLNLTATASTIAIAAANSTLQGVQIVTAIDAVVSAVVITAADATLNDIEFYDAPGLATLIQVITTTAANRLRINGYRFYESTTGTQKTEAIRIVGGSGIELNDIQIRGDFTTATLNNITTLFKDLRANNLLLENLHAASTLAMAVLTTSTGSLHNVLLVTVAGTPWVTTNNILCFDLNSTGTKPTAATSGTAII
jgi:hypothetical protein